MKQLVFKVVDNHPRPRLPREPDGVLFLSLDQAAERFGLSRQTLLDEWNATFGETIGAIGGKIADSEKAPETAPSADSAASASAQSKIPDPQSAMPPGSAIYSPLLAVLREQRFPRLADADLEQVLVFAQARGLDPFGELWADRRFDDFRQEVRLVIGATIEGIRARADRTGLYAGSDAAVHEFDEDWCATRPSATTQTVHKIVAGQPRAFTARVLWSDYYGRSDVGWQNLMPHVALAKCAEAAALRKAFPVELGGVYLAEEMARGSREIRSRDSAEPATPTTASSSASSPSAPRTAGRPADPWEDLGPVTSRQSFELALVEEFGASAKDRKRVHAAAGKRIKTAPFGQPAWYAQAIADVREHPADYGLRRPAEVAA